MPQLKDIFGKALMDYHLGKKKHLKVRRDDGHVDNEDLGKYFEPPEKWLNLERKLLSHAKGLVLDIGFGAGRHMIYLQKTGFNVMGIDISPLAAKVAKKREAGNLIIAAAPNLPFKDKIFDTCIVMLNTLGICGGPNKTLKFLKAIKNILRSRGLLLASLLDPLATENEVHLRYHERNRQLGKPPGLLTIRFEYEDEIGEWFQLYLMTPDEVKVMLMKSGFYLHKVIKNGSWYGIMGERT